MVKEVFLGSKMPSLNFLFHYGYRLNHLKHVCQINELTASTKTFQNVRDPNVKKYVCQFVEYQTRTYYLLTLQSLMTMNPLKYY